MTPDQLNLWAARKWEPEPGVPSSTEQRSPKGFFRAVYANGGHHWEVAPEYDFAHDPAAWDALWACLSEYEKGSVIVKFLQQQDDRVYRLYQAVHAINAIRIWEGTPRLQRLQWLWTACGDASQSPGVPAPPQCAADR